jgi:transaldolase
MTGLEQRAAAGKSLEGIESVASFFVSRVDTEVDKRLAELVSHDKDLAADAARLRGQAGIANSRLAYEVYEQILTTPRWKALEAKGAKAQRLLWASTGVKDKSFPDTRYVVELAAPDTVNTMPEATLHAVADHGEVRGDTIRGSYASAHAVIDDLARIGVDIADVADLLETQGVASFEKSWEELIASVTEQIEKAGATVMPAGAVTPAGGDRAPASGAPGASAGG